MVVEEQEMKGLLTKISALRADILTKDWSDDKNFVMGNKIMYPYLSADKAKKTLAPLLHKHGLEMQMEFDELTERGEVGGFKQHWTIRLRVTLLDVETSAFITSTVYGEAGDVGDKGINKAQTAAIKQWIMSQFLVADGIDPESDSPMVKTAFVPKTREENEEVKSKILAQAVKPAPEPVASQKEAEEIVEQPVVKDIGVPQQKAMEKIISTLRDLVNGGSLDPNTFAKVVSEQQKVNTTAEAIAFIKKYKEMSA